MASAHDGEFDVNIEFNEPCDDFAKASYEEFKDDVETAYANVKFRYPWDKEE